MNADQLLNLGGLGLFAVAVLWELKGMRRDFARVGDWLVAIHSRLSTLGADSLPPPVAAEPTAILPTSARRRQIRTPPPFPVFRPPAPPAAVAELGQVDADVDPNKDGP